jgi:hypothetical protein
MWKYVLAGLVCTAGLSSAPMAWAGCRGDGFVIRTDIAAIPAVDIDRDRETPVSQTIICQHYSIKDTTSEYLNLTWTTWNPGTKGPDLQVGREYFQLGLGRAIIKLDARAQIKIYDGELGAVAKLASMPMETRAFEVVAETSDASSQRWLIFDGGNAFYAVNAAYAETKPTCTSPRAPGGGPKPNIAGSPGSGSGERDCMPFAALAKP